MAPRRVKLAEVTTREAEEDDGEALENFCCSNGLWFEDEVQDYLNEEAIKHVVGEHLSYRLLLCFSGGELIGCAGHHVEPVAVGETGANQLLSLIRIHVLAVGLKYQSRRFDDGTKICDALLRLALTSAAERHPDHGLTAIVANENYRSLAVVERNGRWSQVRYGSRYIRLVGMPPERVTKKSSS